MDLYSGVGTFSAFLEDTHNVVAVEINKKCLSMAHQHLKTTKFFTSPVENSANGQIYFDFGQDFSSKTYQLAIKTLGCGMNSRVRVLLDDYENGEEIGQIEVGPGDGIFRGNIKAVTGRHALYFIPEIKTEGWMRGFFEGRKLFEMVEFVVLK